MKLPMASRIVYSTGQGRMCPDCKKELAHCQCRQAARMPSSDGVVRVRRETSGRKGKGVTVIRGAPLGERQLAGLAKELKRLCGSGGTVKQGAIEIQGDHVSKVIDALQARGWVVKRAGG